MILIKEFTINCFLEADALQRPENLVTSRVEGLEIATKKTNRNRKLHRRNSIKGKIDKIKYSNVWMDCSYVPEEVPLCRGNKS